MIIFQPDWRLLIGLAVTMLVGLGVGCLVHHVGDSLPVEPPNNELRPQWAKLTNQKTAGPWIGLLERPIFFAAFWSPNMWPIMSTWLAFKIAFYWQGVNFSQFPLTLTEEKDANYLVAKAQLGTRRVATALVGTSANILLALVGVAVAKWIKLP